MPLGAKLLKKLIYFYFFVFSNWGRNKLRSPSGSSSRKWLSFFCALSLSFLLVLKFLDERQDRYQPIVNASCACHNNVVSRLFRVLDLMQLRSSTSKCVRICVANERPLAYIPRPNLGCSGVTLTPMKSCPAGALLQRLQEVDPEISVIRK
jgi:hypothetical protein